jgi:hypothetical protein
MALRNFYIPKDVFQVHTRRERDTLVRTVVRGSYPVTPFPRFEIALALDIPFQSLDNGAGQSFTMPQLTDIPHPVYYSESVISSS